MICCDGGNCLTLGERAGSRLNQIDSVAEPVSFVASEEEHSILHDRTANGASVLVHSERESGLTAGPNPVEEITGIQFIVAQ